MATGGLDSCIRRLARGMAAEGIAGETDRQLVERLLTGPDEAASEVLIRRHGPMVYRVCWRVLQQAEDTEDAFQATFLLLAQKLVTLRKKDSLASWLHGIAYRVALDARKLATRRRRHESRANAATTSPPDRVDWEEVRAVLDAELAALPEAQRLPLVLCYLEARTQDEAARHLGWSRSTLVRRLEAARTALGRRLARRGFVWSAAGAAVLLSDAVAPAAPALRTIHSTVEVVGGMLSGRATTSILSTNAFVLAKGVRSSMLLTKLKHVVSALVAAVAVGWAGHLGLPASSAQPQPPLGDTKPQPVKAAPEAAKPKPLPKGPNRLLLGWPDRLSLVDPTGENDKDVLKVNAFGGDSVRLSPDGKRVAYVAHDTTEEKGLLHVTGVDDNEGQSLGVSPRAYAWSSDGSAIAYSEFSEPEKKKKLSAEHGIIDVKTKEKTALQLPEDHYITDWSREGKHFVTTRIWPHAGVFLMNRDGTEYKSLTEKRLPAGSYGVLGRLSADGKRLLFKIVTPQRDKLAKVELAVLDIATGKATPVADVPLNGEIHGHCWSPDGKRIAYCWSESQDNPAVEVIESQVVICDPDGKNATLVVSEKGRVTISGMDWR
jgi:RNA polymerase sigma factor (sigma-70 family)